VTGEYRIGDIRHNFADISRLHSAIGFRPRVSVEEGMRRFANWVQTQPVPEDLLERANAELKARKLMA
jgi:dTDP-L-rhamnose 4-epimerase